MITPLNNSSFVPETKSSGIAEEDKGQLHTPPLPVDRFSPLSEPYPYLPYKVVVHMATYCLAPFVHAAHDLVAPPNSPAACLTSCICNLNALIVIFSGAAKAKQISERLLYSNEAPISVRLPNGKLWTYKVLSLFAGDFLLKFYQELSEEQNTFENRNKSANLYKEVIIGNFFRHTTPIVDQCLTIKMATAEETEQKIIESLKSTLKNLQYNFNSNVLLSLKIDLNSNCHKTDAKTSFVYYINILLPISYNDATNNNYQIHHAFLVEQFYHQDRSSYHRIYSAWEQALTLQDYFKKRGYGTGLEGCLTQTQMSEFIEMFELLLSESEKDLDKDALSEKLFGQPSYGYPPITFFDETNCLLKGLSLRYEVCKIDPTACVKNFNEFIASKEYKLAVPER